MVSGKGALALLVVLAGLVAALVCVSRPRPAQPALFPCDVASAVDLGVRSADGRLVEVSRPSAGATWVVVQPSPGPAQQDLARGMVDSLHSVTADDTLRGARPGDYGLDAPSRTVTCRVASGSSFTLTVGRERFDGGGYYAQKAGDPNVYVISSVPVDEFDNRLKQPPYRGDLLASPSPTS